MWRRRAALLATLASVAAMEACGDANPAEAAPPVLVMSALSPLTQQGTVGQLVASKPMVRVTDASGTPVAGVKVIFSAADTAFPPVTTGVDGTASADWRLSHVAGTQTLLARLYSAKLVSLGPATTFTALALADTLAGLQVYSFPSQLGFPSTAVPIPPVIVAVDKYSNRKVGVEVTFEVSGGGSVVPSKATTDSIGRAIVGTWTLGTGYGTDTLIAHIPNFPPLYLTVSVPPPFVVSTIVAGSEHTCAISSGDVYCWGSNTSGQVKPGDPTRFWVVPQMVPLGVKAVSIASGYNHTCAISNEDPPQAYCWGDNSTGQLGVQTPGSGPVRVPVAGGLASVATGSDHSCGLTPAGVAYCWGNGGDGQLGNGGASTCAVSSGGATGCLGPQPVKTDLRFTSMAAGVEHTCGLIVIGQMYCWGLNNGLGSPAGTQCDFNGDDYYYYYYYSGNYPVACALVPQGGISTRPFAVIATGFGTCALTIDGTVVCGGSADGSPAPPAQPVNTLSSDGGCGLDADGAALCWISGFDAQGASFSQPASLDAGTTFTLITAAQHHRCGILKSTGGAVCWGSNDFGQLGSETAGGSLIPTPVTSPRTTSP